MGIKRLLLEFIIVLAVITCLVIVVDSLRIRYDATEHVAKLQEQYFNATYEIYKDEIIGNLLIGDQNVENSLLKEIAEHRGIGLRLTYKTLDIQTGDFATRNPAQIYELDLGNNNKAELAFYALNDLKNPLSFSNLGISLFLELFVLGFGFMYLLWRFNKKLLAPLEDLVSHLKPEQIESYISPAASVCEVKELAENMKLMREAVQKRAIHEAEITAAKQVAHDIRSPLTTLSRLLKNLSQFSEQERILLRNAVQRITDIANNLLAKYQDVIYVYSVDAQAELISDLLSLVVSEKRAQYSDLNIDLCLEIVPEAYCAFARVNASAFKQNISNLIDNAVEAITNNSGQVFVRLLFMDNKYLKLTIEDNGCGIPYELVRNVLRGGVTSKKDGYGMGLSKARKMFEELNGALSIESQVDFGTKIIITLPQSEVAEWFIGKISITKNCKIVILDDDLSSHHMWTDCFQSKTNQSDNIQLFHINDVQSFISFYSMHKKDVLLFLIDYDLLHDEIDGLDLVEQFNIANNTILVTNKYDYAEVRIKAKTMTVKILPKIYVPHVQIEIICKEDKYVLLDDDHMVCDLWQLMAERAGKSVVTFTDPDEFKKHVLKCTKETEIYIDSKLQADIKGEMIAKELYDLGYLNIYLASGYPASRFAHVTWVRGVVGKEPPF